MFTVKNESSICAIIVINKIHNKGARLKHKRINKNKLEPFFMIKHLDEEIEDSVPSVIAHQRLDSIQEKESADSGK